MYAIISKPTEVVPAANVLVPAGDDQLQPGLYLSSNSQLRGTSHSHRGSAYLEEDPVHNGLDEFERKNQQEIPSAIITDKEPTEIPK